MSIPSPTVPQAGSPQSEPTGHTPGPWYIVRTEGDGRIASVYCYDETGYVNIAADRKWDEFESFDAVMAENRANARLMAAAPDLLAACKAVQPLLLLAVIKAPNKEYAVQYQATLDVVNAAIARGVA